MAYKTADLEAQSIDLIKKHNLVFIEDIVALLPCDKTTFYAHKLNESNAIKGLIEKNKTSIKVGLRKKMYDADNAAAWAMLYKLIGSDDEADRLNGSRQKVELTGADGKPVQIETRVILPPDVSNGDSEV